MQYPRYQNMEPSTELTSPESTLHEMSPAAFEGRYSGGTPALERVVDTPEPGHQQQQEFVYSRPASVCSEASSIHEMPPDHSDDVHPSMFDERGQPYYPSHTQANYRYSTDYPGIGGVGHNQSYADEQQMNSSFRQGNQHGYGGYEYPNHQHQGYNQGHHQPQSSYGHHPTSNVQAPYYNYPNRGYAPPHRAALEQQAGNYGQYGNYGNRSFDGNYQNGGGYNQPRVADYQNQTFDATINRIPYDSNSSHRAPASESGSYQGMAGNYPGMAGMPNIAGMGAVMTPQLREWFSKYEVWLWHYNKQKFGETHRLTPHKFPTRHSRVTFGPNNQLFVATESSILCQQIDPALIDLHSNVLITTWPGPLNKEETNKAEVLEYIRAHENIQRPSEAHTYSSDHEKREIWQVLLMLCRQNGLVSGADLAELIMTNNSTDFETSDQGTEVSQLRQYLMLGQRKTATEYANKTGQWGHSFALTYLTMSSDFHPTTKPIPICNQLLKFLNTTLSRDDPIHLLYRCLLQKLEDLFQGTAGTVKNVQSANLQQFAILLANDCEVSSTISGHATNSELLKFIVALRSNEVHHLIDICHSDTKQTDPRFSEELVFANEIYEYSRSVPELIYQLVPLKTILMTKLYDFGLLPQAKRYCATLRSAVNSYSYMKNEHQVESNWMNVNWRVVVAVLNDVESRMYGENIQQQIDEETDELSNAQSDPLSSSPEDLVDHESGREELVQSVASVNIQRIRFEEKGREQPTPTNSVRQSQKISQTPQIPEENNITKQSTTDIRERQPSIQSMEPHKIPAPLTPIDNSPVPKSQNENSYFVPAPLQNTDQSPIDFITSNNGYEKKYTPDEIDAIESAGDNAKQFSNIHKKSNSDRKLNSTENNINPQHGIFSPTFSPIMSPISEQHSLKTSRIDPPSPQLNFPRSEPVKPPVEENQNSKDQKQEKPKGGFLDSIRSKFLPKTAHLPDDSNPSIVWDVSTNSWVDKDADANSASNQAIRNGPPVMPAHNNSFKVNPAFKPPSNGPQNPMMALPTGNFDSTQFQVVRRKQNRYVDLWQQQQQQQQHKTS